MVELNHWLKKCIVQHTKIIHNGKLGKGANRENTNKCFDNVQHFISVFFPLVNVTWVKKEKKSLDWNTVTRTRAKRS